MLKINEPIQTDSSPALFQLGFRPFFLFGALYSVIGVLMWVMLISGFIQFSPYGGSLWWHGHEMIFGFVAAIITGFLLTAVQNWTGIPSIKGRQLMLLFSIWLIARILLAIGYESIISTLIDIIFLPLAALFLAIPIIKIKQYRNLIFVPLLLLLSVANILMHMNIYSSEFNGFQLGSYSAIMLIMLLMMIMGGRVIPFFTANSTGILKTEPLKWLELSSLFLGATLAMIFLTGMQHIEKLASTLAGIFYLTAALHLIRWSRWRFWTTFKTPLLWSLHVSYLMIPIGCLLLGIHFSHQSISIQSALHIITIGAIGLMIIAMISRVSLGHTGRALKPHWLMTLAFRCILFATFIRFIGSVYLHEYIREAFLITGLFWALGYGLFFVIYYNVLTRPRVDGRPG